MNLNLTDEQKRHLVSIVVGALVAVVSVLLGVNAESGKPPAPVPVVTPGGGVITPKDFVSTGIKCNASSDPCVESDWGRNLVVYSDQATTQKFSVTGSSGLVSTAGGVTLSGGQIALANGSRVLPQLSGGINVTSTTGLYACTNTVARTDTANKVICQIPANAALTDVTLYYTTASNAGTTATLSCGKTPATPTEYINAANVLAAAGLIRAGSGATMPSANLGAVGASDVPVFCKYAETGTASSTGGPFTVIIQFAQ